MRSPSSLYRYLPFKELSFPGGSAVKNLPANAGDARALSSVPGSGRSPGGGNGKPLQYSCLGNPIDRGRAWRATVLGVAESDTTEWLSNINSVFLEWKQRGNQEKQRLSQTPLIGREQPGHPHTVALGGHRASCCVPPIYSKRVAPAASCKSLPLLFFSSLCIYSIV